MWPIDYIYIQCKTLAFVVPFIKVWGEPSFWARYTGNRVPSAGRMATLNRKRRGEHKERWRLIDIRLFPSLCSLYHCVFPNKLPRYAVRKFELTHRSIWHAALLSIATEFKCNMAPLAQETILQDQTTGSHLVDTIVGRSSHVTRMPPRKCQQMDCGITYICDVILFRLYTFSKTYCEIWNLFSDPR
jgi:hypothetical protein